MMKVATHGSVRDMSHPAMDAKEHGQILLRDPSIWGMLTARLDA